MASGRGYIVRSRSLGIGSDKVPARHRKYPRTSSMLTAYCGVLLRLAARLRLILPDRTAIGVGLSHASRTPGGMAGRGGRLSNAWLTYPREGDNPGKLGLIPHRRGHLEWVRTERGVTPSSSRSPEDGAASYQVVGGVMARQADNG